MDFFTDQVKKKFSDKKPESSDPEPNHNKNTPDHTEPTTHKPVSNTDPTAHRPASNAELMASAKIVAEAAQAAARNESDKLDKAKVAGATADILDAASRYGKLDEKSGVGQYLEKAEQYLHKYETSHSHSSGGGSHGTAGTGGSHGGVATGGSHGGVGTGGSHGGGAGAPASKKEDEKSGGGHGFGDYAKMAQGFMK
ncbi:PREDICTED: nodulin-related protein 1-like [Camelina sativa]|uniref:Nodulin-related protein 1-like n=1 Tax=Camelina sativa TaxID=90675 RepID=A0ABM0ZD80_CAMSA|nr:PREDICTED: nodulin-related protein 1-like [Camelina sativa]